ncbi:MAG: metalloenzyme domain-containing protein [Chloroflexi bacterium]|nr:metalloenzyme domain-containing protein [Chloroflexota bacterium]
MRLLFLFLDGVGLGANDPNQNPFVRAKMPNLINLLDGQRLHALEGKLPFHGARASLVPIDACLGIPGLPQSASGQATLLTGKNIPQIIGEHYGPKPNAAIRAILENDNLFHRLRQNNQRTALINAFPDGYFAGIQSGKRLPGAIAMAMRAANIPLKTEADLLAGNALSADFTASGWHKHLDYTHIPILTPTEAGRRLAILAKGYELTFFEYWLSDVLGHRRDMAAACERLEEFDAMLGGLLKTWDDDQGLILITSDHGNLEDLSTRRHTSNPVPGLVIGAAGLRHPFSEKLHNLADITPAIQHFFAS